MAKTSSTPLGAMFSILKRYGGISYKELATLILSEKPLAGGVSPASRVNDRTWVSRYLVHAPAEAVRSEYFVSYEKCAMRIIARLKKRTGNTLGNREIMEMVAGTPGQEMVAALQNAGQDATPYLNMLARLDKEGGFRAEERMEIAMVLFVAVALSANVAEATAYALDFTSEIHGASMATPLVTPNSEDADIEGLRERIDGQMTTLGLLRVVESYVMGSPHWLDAELAEEFEVGAFATGPDAITDVENDVSGHHARIWHDGAGAWFVEGSGSKNGTVLVSGVDRSEVIVEPPADEREGWESVPVALKPGDELVFGKNTHYVVIAGVR